MAEKNLNRLKVVLAEKNLSNKWLSEQLGVGQATISKWVTNTSQPNLEMLLRLSDCLEVPLEDRSSGRIRNKKGRNGKAIFNE